MLGLMLMFLIGSIFLGFLLVPVLFLIKAAQGTKNSEPVNCLKCGKEYRLYKGGSDCPKCNTRNFKDNNGNLMI